MKDNQNSPLFIELTDCESESIYGGKFSLKKIGKVLKVAGAVVFAGTLVAATAGIGVGALPIFASWGAMTTGILTEEG